MHLHFLNDRCVVQKKENGLYGYIDKNGNEITGFIYKHCEDFNEGLACVDDGYIDNNGNYVWKK